jgi:hypothetical protein
MRAYKLFGADITINGIDNYFGELIINSRKGIKSIEGMYCIYYFDENMFGKYINIVNRIRYGKIRRRL